jgi:hypothetical protein
MQPNNVPAISTVDGEPRILDTDLAESLGFDRPLNIRKIIARHAKNLSNFSVLSTVEKTPLPGSGGGRPTQEYWLNKQQALFITTKSDAPTEALRGDIVNLTGAMCATAA